MWAAVQEASCLLLLQKFDDACDLFAADTPSAGFERFTYYGCLMLQGYDDARDHVFSAVEPDDIVRVWQPVQPVGALVAVLYMAEGGLAKLQQGPLGKCVAGCVGAAWVQVAWAYQSLPLKHFAPAACCPCACKKHRVHWCCEACAAPAWDAA